MICCEDAEWWRPADANFCWCTESDCGIQNIITKQYFVSSLVAVLQLFLLLRQCDARGRLKASWKHLFQLSLACVFAPKQESTALFIHIQTNRTKHEMFGSEHISQSIEVWKRPWFRPKMEGHLDCHLVKFFIIEQISSCDMYPKHSINKSSYITDTQDWKSPVGMLISWDITLNSFPLVLSLSISFPNRILLLLAS